MQLWLDGKAHIRVRKEIGDGRLKAIWQGKLITVWKSEVAEWCDDWFFSCLDLWYRWKMFGCLPFTGGWAEQPAHLVEIIETLQTAYKQHEAREW